MGLAIRVTSALTDLDVPPPTPSLYLRCVSTGPDVYEWATAGVADHGGLTGLGDDDHAQYALIAGRAGGQTLNMDTASGGAGTINASAHATKGALTLGASQVLIPNGTGSLPALAFAALTSAGIWYNPATPAVLFRQSTGNEIEIRSTMMIFSSSSSPGLYLTPGAAQMRRLVTIAGSAGEVPYIARGAAAQTANLQEWQNSAGTVLARVNQVGDLFLTQTNSSIYFGPGTPKLSLPSGGTLTIQDGGSQTLATFIHNAGGTLRNAGTTRIEWNATGIGFFAATPVARPTPADHVAAIAALDTLGLTAGSPALSATQLLLPAGTVGAPAIMVSDGGGLYRGATGYLNISTAGVRRFQISSAGLLLTVPIVPDSAAGVPLTIKLAASQSANAQEWQNSAGAVLASVNASGQFKARNTISVQTSGGSDSGSLYGSAQDTMALTCSGPGGGTPVVTVKNNAGVRELSFFNVATVPRPTALTAADASALNTGDATSDTVIGNMRTRIGELETKLQSLGLLT